MRMLGLPRKVEPLVVQTATIVVGGVLIVAITLTSFVLTHRGIDSARHEMRAAVAADEINASAAELRSAGLDSLESGTPAAAGGQSDVWLAIESSRLVDAANQSSARLAQLLPPAQTLLLRQSVERMGAAFDEYVRAPAADRYGPFILYVVAVQAISDERATTFQDRVADDQAQVSQLTFWALLANVSVVLGVIGVIAYTGVITNRRLGKALAEARRERGSLLEANRAVERRNTQLAALYQIVTEIAESLSLTYVVNTTVRETRRLLNADTVVLRLVEEDKLVVVGFDADEMLDLSALAPVALGEGVVGRVAKRGKTALISEDVQEQMAEAERIPGVTTAVVVPLIVGAKVVGTLGCGARVSGTFTEDDQVILELMASQVATAVAAANVYAASEDAAHHDALTALPNRRQLVDDLRTRIAALIRDRKPIIVAMLDIDNFKNLNDEYGHRVGDVTLQRVAHAIRASLRQEDLVYRYGGEEFVAIMPNTLPKQGYELAERLRQQIAQLALTGENMESVGPVTVSIGLASFPADGEDVSALIRLSDEAMYEAKQTGRNRVCAYSSAVERAPPPKKAA